MLGGVRHSLASRVFVWLCLGEGGERVCQQGGSSGHDHDHDGGDGDGFSFRVEVNEWVEGRVYFMYRATDDSSVMSMGGGKGRRDLDS